MDQRIMQDFLLKQLLGIGPPANGRRFASTTSNKKLPCALSVFPSGPLPYAGLKLLLPRHLLQVVLFHKHNVQICFNHGWIRKIAQYEIVPGSNAYHIEPDPLHRLCWYHHSVQIHKSDNTTCEEGTYLCNTEIWASTGAHSEKFHNMWVYVSCLPSWTTDFLQHQEESKWEPVVFIDDLWFSFRRKSPNFVV